MGFKDNKRVINFSFDGIMPCIRRGSGVNHMKRLAIIILVITLLFAFTLPALAQQGQGKGLDNAPGQNKDKDGAFPVPEPMTAVLLLAGLLGGAGLMWRIRQK